jgi:hypothetical protein
MTGVRIQESEVRIKAGDRIQGPGWKAQTAFLFS